VTDVVVIGSGPAGLAAAIYTARAKLSTVVVTGSQLGGQLALTWEIDNYPGFLESPTGAELTDLFAKHAEKHGATLVFDEAVEVEFGQGSHRVQLHGDVIQARAVVVATGATARHLGVPGESKLVGRGVSYCATCDGGFFRGRRVVVVGGGDTAVEEAIYLTRFVDSLRIVHRRDELRAGPGLQERARATGTIGFEWNTVVDEILGTDKVEGVRLRRLDTGDERVEPVDGVFIFVGHTPSSELFRGKLELDEAGYVKVDDRMNTSVPGVFAAGEIMDPHWRQGTTSIGQGSAAGISVVRYLV
jgi:thioredoxin reductase (NADPH)